MADENNQNNIIAHREYIIKTEDNEYNLRIEIDKEYIYFILSKLNEPLEYTYKNKMDLSTIVNKFELNTSKYSTLESVLGIFDTIYEKNKFKIDINDDNSCNLCVKLINVFEKEVTNEIKLYKEFMTNNDKFNLLYSKIQLLNISNSNHSSEDNSVFENKLNQKEEEMKNILNKKDMIIKEMNEKLLKQENELKKISNESLNDIINKKIKEIENKVVNNLNEKFDALKKQLLNDINKQNELIEKLKEKIKIQGKEEKNSNLNEKVDFMKDKEKNKEKGINSQEVVKNNEVENKNSSKNNFLKEGSSFKEELKEIKNKINSYEKKIIKLDNTIKEDEVVINNLKEKINEDNNLLNQINKKIEEINKNKKNEKSIIINEINNKIVKNENIINSKIEEKLKEINNQNKDKFDNNKLKELSDNINNKYNELKERINHNEYFNKMHYEFTNNPINLKYKADITLTNTNAGWNDMFEVFLCYKDNKEYVVSPNNNSYNLDIYDLLDNKKKLSLRGHKNDIRTVRYFINNRNYKEYLISADDNKLVIVWEVSDNYNIKNQIDTKYGNNIYSCLLVFPINNDNNYIITSTYHDSDDMDTSATKVYSLNNGRLMKYLNNSNYDPIYYLLVWHNKRNNRYYIIQFSYLKILMNDLFDNEIYYELVQEPETDHFSGFIYTRDNYDYLISSSENGFINIWDLYTKKIFKVINTNKCLLAHIIQWNEDYFIVADFNNKSFIIVDLEEDKLMSIYNIEHTKQVKCIKKIKHPIYGESLLSCSKDNSIKLWAL